MAWLAAVVATAYSLFQGSLFVKAVFTLCSAFPHGLLRDECFLTGFSRLLLFPVFQHLAAALAVFGVECQAGDELPAAPLALLFHAPDAVFGSESAFRKLPACHHSFPVACFSRSSQISFS